MKPIQVPMALRAEIKVPVGPLQVPLRTAVLLLVTAPAVLTLLLLPLSLSTQLMVGAILVGTASAISRPNREGVWIGTWLAYRVVEPFLPQLVRSGRPRSATVRRVGGHLQLGARDREPLSAPGALSRWTGVPRARQVVRGAFQRDPGGGWVAVLELSGPRDAPVTQGYADWSLATVDWLNTVNCPVQLFTEVTRCDRAQAQNAFERGLRRERTVLVDLERDLAGRVAERTLAVRQYVVLAPRWAGSDGVPTTNRVTRVLQTAEASRAEAERVRDLAARQAETLGLGVRPLEAAEIRALLGRTPAGCEEAVFQGGETVIGERYVHYGAVTELPNRVHPGSVMAAMIRARVRGSCSYYVFPVQAGEARKELRRQRSLYEAMWRRSRTPDTEMLYQHTKALDEMLLSKQTSALRVALTVAVEAEGSQEAAQSFERLQAALLDEDLALERVTAPISAIAASAAPGGLPLNRGLFLTTSDVAAYLLTAQGTAFGDPSRPLVGIDAATGATCWYSVFDRNNFSALILGSSGAGKSVAAKTLLVRHHLQGADVLVIDPESEYRSVTKALGGEYVELGEQSLNAFAIDPSISAEEAAGWVTRTLSVLGGEERDYRNNRPVRSLPAQDLAWLFSEVVEFIEAWRQAGPWREPVLGDFCAHLEGPALQRATQLNVEGRVKRCADIAERLRVYTQGDKGLVFNRPSSVTLRGPAVGVGLSRLASQLRADLTPALAFVLAALLGELHKTSRRRIILVDEAHRVLSDPDAGEVLADVVRTSRKRGAGVWMASQSMRDFLSSGSGDRPTPGEVLATVAATKLVLGVEHGLERGVQETFQLTDRELAALTAQRQPGRGVLIGEAERAIVDVAPGPHLLPVVSTSAIEPAA